MTILKGKERSSLAYLIQDLYTLGLSYGSPKPTGITSTHFAKAKAE